MHPVYTIITKNCLLKKKQKSNTNHQTKKKQPTSKPKIIIIKENNPCNPKLCFFMWEIVCEPNMMEVMYITDVMY